MGPRAARTGLGPAAERERETGSGRRERVEWEVPPRPGPGARLGAEERGFPTADPTKTLGEPRPSPACLAAWAPGQEKVAGSLLGTAGRRHHGGGGSPVRPTRGRAPSPPRPASPAPHDRGSPAGPRLPHKRRRRRWKAQGAEGGRGRGKGESWAQVCFVLPGWRRARPRGRTSSRASGVPRPRSGRRGAALAGSLPAPRPGLSRSASPSSSRPPARSRSLD